MTRPAHVLVLGVLFGLFTQTALASSLEQTGKPEQQITVTKTYGVGVTTAKALRTLVPSGWRTFIQPSAELPDSMSWDVGQEWTAVLSKLADTGKVAVHVDWAEKSVFIRKPGSSAVIGSAVADAAHDALTPLPRFEPVSLAAAVGLSKAVPPAISPHIAEASAAVVSPSPAKSINADINPVAPTAVAAVVEKSREDMLPQATAPVFTQKGSIAPSVQDKQLAIENTKLNDEVTRLKAELTASQVARERNEAIATNHKEALASIVADAQNAPNAAMPEFPAPVVDLSAKPLAPLAAVSAVPAQPAVQASTAVEMADALIAQAPGVTPRTTLATSGSDDFAYTKPIGLNKPDARKVAQGIASRFHLRLVWAAPEVQLRGSVTLLGASAEEDMTLLGKALGHFSPVRMEIPTGQGILLVVSKTGVYPDIATNSFPTDSRLAAQTNGDTDSRTNRHVEGITIEPVSAAHVVAATGTPALSPTLATVAVSAKALEPAPVVVAPVVELATGYVLTVNRGEPLELAIPQFARENGFTVEWQVSGGFEAKRSMTFAGESIKDVLLQVLPKLGVSADINKQTSHIVVRPVDPARDF